MLNYALIKSPLNWLTVILMVMLAQLFYEVVTDPNAIRTCGCNN